MLSSHCACALSLSLTGFYAAAEANRRPDVLWQSERRWPWHQTAHRCWSAGLQCQRSYIHRYRSNTTEIHLLFVKILDFALLIQQNKELVCMALVCLSTDACVIVLTVEGGQRAIIFNRIGGMQMDTVLAEGLHFRFRIITRFYIQTL